MLLLQCCVVSSVYFVSKVGFCLVSVVCHAHSTSSAAQTLANIPKWKENHANASVA